MTTYQCFFFSEGVIQFWENVEVDAEIHLPAALRSRLFEDEWTFAEAWLGETLVCRVDKNVQAYHLYAA